MADRQRASQSCPARRCRFPRLLESHTVASVLPEVANGSPIATPLWRHRIRSGDLLIVAICSFRTRGTRVEQDGQSG